MISDEFRFQQFAESAYGKEYHEIIYLAEQEALQAWRMAHPSKGMPLEDRTRSLHYQRKLLDLIAYLRHGIVAQECDERLAALFRSVREGVSTDTLQAC